MNRELRNKVLRILDCYYEDMRYHEHVSGLDGFNAVTYQTPSFDSEHELQEYLAEVHNIIGEFLSVTREKS